MLPKIHINSKKASNESCSKLNFVQKSPQAHISISPRSGATTFEGLIWLLYYIILKLPITFNLGPNAAKNTHYFKKKFQMKVVQN